MNQNLINNYISEIEYISNAIADNRLSNEDHVEIIGMIEYSKSVMNMEGLHLKSLKAINIPLNLELYVTDCFDIMVSCLYGYRIGKSNKKYIERFEFNKNIILQNLNNVIESYNSILFIFDKLIDVLPKIIKNMNIFVKKSIKFNKLYKNISKIVKQHIVKITIILKDITVCKNVIVDVNNVYKDLYIKLDNMYIKDDYEFYDE